LLLIAACQPSSTTIVWFGSVDEEAGFACGRGQGVRVGRHLGFLEFRCAADRFDGDRFDHQFLALVDEAEAGLVRGLEGGLHFVERANRLILRDGASRLLRMRRFVFARVFLTLILRSARRARLEG
jgi:hypothetical protein